MFIQDYLSKNDIEQRKWYTSGQEIGNRWTWTSINAVLSYDQGFLDETSDFYGSYLAYYYKCIDNFLFIVILFNFMFEIKFSF